MRLHGITFGGLASTLLSIDLSKNWTNATVAIQSTTKPDGVPNLNSPSLWYHEAEDLIYSGFAGWNSTFGDEPEIPPLSLWTFKPDGSGSGIWNETIAANSSVWSQLTRPGQPLMAVGPINAWVLGGITTEWGDWASPENLIPGMVQFDMISRTFLNTSVQCCNATGGIYKGALEHIATFGPAEVFIAMGGQNGIGNDGVTAGLIDFGMVSVFDASKQKWRNQTTTGSKPSPRVEFCTASLKSTNGTYEMLDASLPKNFICPKLTVSLDLCMRAGAHILVQQPFNTTQSIFSLYQPFTGSVFRTIPKTLDMHFLATRLAEVRYLLLGALTRIHRSPVV